VSRFATGKSTALVVDVGHKQTVVTPVYDGYAIKKAIVTENIGGDMLTKAAVKVLEARNVNLTPHFKILRKKAVEFGKPAEIQLKKLQHLTHSFDLSAKMRVATDFKETVCAVSDTVYNERYYLSIYLSLYLRRLLLTIIV
jgi:actin-like protein 6A